ncbi:TadE/TadG family type IV pilus assembly protein [Fuerstiella marisgermanici]|uniref:TadE-like domain-containing protein n=1 Tax=Fuerstiella marisgermanici TaxID=1891926 RepID=A0A1P8WMV2_9PLAN|nr:hypothetical protein Fuma_05060 [Fuerstiella marisgermanici]
MRSAPTATNTATPRSVACAETKGRSGVVVAESAIVLIVVVVSCMAVLDLGMNVARSNSLSDCARHAARFAMLHGSTAPEGLGPQEWSGTVSDDHPVADIIRNRLLAMAPDAVGLTITWPDGGNSKSERVTVELEFQPPQLSAISSGLSPLQARSTMRILR